MENTIRNYLDDFHREFRSDGQIRTSPNSIDSFYEKWRMFIELMTGVRLSLTRVTWDNVLEVFSISHTTALRCAQSF